MALSLVISDLGRTFELDYDGLLAYRGGGAVAGAAVGFRVMQAAAAFLRKPVRPLERQHLHVVSGHPGPGYRDAFEYVTRCVSRDRFVLDRDLPGGRYSPYHSYAFQFIISDSDAGKQATVTVRDGFMPLRFFEVLRDLKNAGNAPALADELEKLKRRIADKAIGLELDELFDVQVQDTLTPTAFKPGASSACLG